MNKIQKFLKKNQVEVSDIKYILRQKGQTLLYLFDKEPLTTYIPAKTIVDGLVPDMFIHINKGVYLNSHFVINIEKNIYTMVDNHKFEGRKRLTQKQKDFHYQWRSMKNAPDFTGSLLSDLSAFDDCPLGFCIIEIVFNDDGSGIDFIFRYCNKKMESIEGLSIDQMVDHSFYKLFHGDGLKWLASYVDVAMNNTQKIIHEYSPKLKKHLSVYCFQVRERFCGCIVFDSADVIKDIFSHIQPTSDSSFSVVSPITKKHG